MGVMQHQRTDDGDARPFQPRTERHMTVLVNAGVRQRGRNGICRIRNVSTGGLAIETHLSLVVGEAATVTLSSGRELPCTVQWVRDGRAGMSCPADPAASLRDDRTERAVPQAGPTLPRFYSSAHTMIRLHGRHHRCTLDSLSTSDILLSDTPPLATGDAVIVVVAGLGEFAASVCISHGGDLFARFTPHLPFRLLDDWLAAAD